MAEDFLRIVKQHMERYPAMEQQDFGKLVFQGVFGPEHMIADRRQAEKFLVEEWKTLSGEDAAGVFGKSDKMSQQISESLCRFPLSVCSSEDEAKLLAHLFYATAKERKGTREELEEKLERLRELQIPGMEAWTAAWKQEGYPPVHHSAAYRERYHPHYRLVQKEYADYFAAFSAVYSLMQKKGSAVIAIDGRCGSGKTYLAGLLDRLFSCRICHMDDFYMPLEERPPNWMEIPGGNMNLDRFLKEVLRPAKKGRQIAYRAYDCKKNEMGETIRMPAADLTVVEGSYSCHPQLIAEYDLTIFLTCGREEQRRRLRMREGDYYPVFEKRWIPLEEKYFSRYAIETGSHLVIDTSDFC